MGPTWSSSSDPNAPYHAAIASLVDCNFFADAKPEQPDITYLMNQKTNQHDSFEGISPRRLTQSTCLNRTAEATLSSAAALVTIATIRQYLRDQGYSGGRIRDATVESRLFSTNLSAKTLLTALQIAHDANHALLVRLGVNSNDREILVARLNGIMLTSQGFFTGMRKAKQRKKPITIPINSSLAFYSISLNAFIHHPYQYGCLTCIDLIVCVPFSSNKGCCKHFCV